MFRKILATLLMLATFFVAACSEQTETKVNKNLVVYSELDQAFTDELVKAYGQRTKNVSISAIYELKQGATTPDIILALIRKLAKAFSLPAILTIKQCNAL